MSALPTSADVVIVGAGPAGPALAGVLASEGVSFVIVDRLAEGAVDYGRSCTANYCDSGTGGVIQLRKRNCRLEAMRRFVL